MNVFASHVRTLLQGEGTQPTKTLDTMPRSRYFTTAPNQSELQQFSDIYYDQDRPVNFSFPSFDSAIQYGKKLANQLGFQLRIKTTGVNAREGIVYKYVCCQRQGLAEHGWKPKDGVRLRQRDSVRCDCKWNCKLLGVKINHEPVRTTDPQPPTPRDSDSDLLWIWKKADDDKEYEHNHVMDLSFKVSSQQQPTRCKPSIVSPKTSLVTPPLSGSQIDSRRSSSSNLKYGIHGAGVSSRRPSVQQDNPMGLLALIAEERAPSPRQTLTPRDDNITTPYRRPHADSNASSISSSVAINMTSYGKSNLQRPITMGQSDSYNPPTRIVASITIGTPKDITPNLVKEHLAPIPADLNSVKVVNNTSRKHTLEPEIGVDMRLSIKGELAVQLVPHKKRSGLYRTNAPASIGPLRVPSNVISHSNVPPSLAKIL